MKDFKNMSELELEKVLAVTRAIADKQPLDTANLTADESNLQEAEENAKRYAEARRSNRTTLTVGEPTEDEDGDIAERIRNWRRVTNRR